MRIDNNIIAFLLLATVFILASRTMDRHERLNKRFLAMSIAVLIGMFIEILTCVINGSRDAGLTVVSCVLHVGLFGIAPVLAYTWFMFIVDWVVPVAKLSKLKKALLLLPIVLNVLLTVLSPFYGFVFYFDAAHIYHRGALFIFSSGIVYMYLILSIATVMRHRRKLVRHDFLPVIIACVFPAVGGLLQTLFYGLLLMWSSCAYMLVIVYIFLQKRMIHLDGLTGAWTRGSLDYFMSCKVDRNGDRFGIILADIDNLKGINDEFGHCEGDHAIKAVVRLIRGVLRKPDVLARTGGDEFIIVMDCDSVDALNNAIERIQAGFDQYNSQAGGAYRLECSFGAAMYEPVFPSVEQYMRHVDDMMYANKREKKAVRPCGRPTPAVTNSYI